MGDTIRVGMAGTSWYADGMHLPLLKSHARAQVTAICGRNQARAAELAAKYAIPKVFTDYREMMNRELLDAVVIAVPDELHYPMTMAALGAGLHVLAEKPLAMNLAQAREMLEAAKAAGVKHMTYFTYRWTPYTRLVQKLVKEGYIGECYDAQLEYFGSYAFDNYYQWKWDREHGLGILGDLGSHMIDMAHLLVGDIDMVSARLSARIPRAHPEGRAFQQASDSATLLVQFANGATGSIFLSADAEVGDRGQVQRVQLTGSAGTLEMVADMQGYQVRGLRRGEKEFRVQDIPAEFLEGSQPGLSTWDQLVQTFFHQSIGTRLFIDSIAADCGIVPGLEEGVAAQAVIDAALRSDASGCWEQVESSR